MSGISAVGNTDPTPARFSSILKQMKSGLSPVGGANGDASSSNGEDTVTVQRMLPDGSMLIVVMKGDQVISETKTHAPQKNVNMLQPDGTVSFVDKFNDTSTSLTAGLFINSGI